MKRKNLKLKKNQMALKKEAEKLDVSFKSVILNCLRKLIIRVVDVAPTPSFFWQFYHDWMFGFFEMFFGMSSR